MKGNIQRKLGATGIEISALGMGCRAIGGPFWEGRDALGWSGVNDQASIKAIHLALDLEVTFFDTADVYGAGHSERVLAEALGTNRKHVVLATKFGICFDETTKQVTGTSADPAHIRQACDNSLRRLNTDYIDLYQFHLNDYDQVRVTSVLETLEGLVSAGKIRYYGWSTDFVDRAKVFARGPNCVSIQHQHNVLNDSSEMIDFCEHHYLTSINRGPLAMGMLTGKYTADASLPADDVRGKQNPVWMEYFKDGKPNAVWLDKMKLISEILCSDGRTLAQGALAWLWARSPQNIPIPGFKNSTQVEGNCNAMEFGPLKADQMAEIRSLLGGDKE